jgi:hypothetical protein
MSIQECMESQYLGCETISSSAGDFTDVLGCALPQVKQGLAVEHDLCSGLLAEQRLKVGGCNDTPAGAVWGA